MLPAGLLREPGGLLPCLARLHVPLLSQVNLRDIGSDWVADIPGSVVLVTLDIAGGLEGLPLGPPHGLGGRGRRLPGVLEGGVDGVPAWRFIESLIFLLGD